MTRTEEQAVRDLLARIHRDGGHHTERVGLLQSLLDAEAVYLEMCSQISTLTFQLARETEVVLPTEWVENKP